MSLTELKAKAFDAEDELTQWDRFRLTIGDEPRNSLLVYEQDEKYRVIDGDRRARALRENGVEEGIPVNIMEGDYTEAELVAFAIQTNEQREGNDPTARAWNTAQHVAPWLLDPNEHKEGVGEDGVRDMDQEEWARRCGTSQATVSKWLEPMRDEHPIRAALAGKTEVGVPTETEMELIDETMEFLFGHEGDKVVLKGQEEMVAEAIKGMEGVSVREIRNAAEKAADEGMTEQEFIDHVEEAYAPSEETEESVGTEDLEMVDESTSEPRDTSSGTATETADEETAEMPEPPEEEELPFGGEVPDVEWGEYVDDDDLPTAHTVGQIERQRMQVIRFEGESAVALKLLGTLYGVDIQDLGEEFVGPMIVKEVANIIKDRYG